MDLILEDWMLDTNQTLGFLLPLWILVVRQILDQLRKYSMEEIAQKGICLQDSSMEDAAQTWVQF